METISLIDAVDGVEYVLVVNAESALRAQNDKEYAQKLLDESRSLAAAEEEKVLEDDGHRKWPEAIVPTLLSEYKSMEEEFLKEQKILGGGGVSKCWQTLADRLEIFGYKCTPLQCRNKITTLRKAYRRMTLGKSNPNNWPYAQQMIEIFSEEVSRRRGGEIQTSFTTDAEDFSYPEHSRQIKLFKGPKVHSATCKDALRIREQHHKERMEFKYELLENLKQMPSHKERKVMKMSMSEVLEHVAAIIDSSSDESDCACPGSTSFKAIRKHKESPFVDTEIPSLTEEEFKNQFRMTRGTFEFVMSLIGPYLNKMTASAEEAVCERRQLLVTLWIMSNPDTYRSVGARFNVGGGTCLIFVRRVTKALLKFSSKFIKWPMSSDEVSNGFYRISGFPSVIGAIASTYIAIPVLKTNIDIFRNSKGKPSVFLQVVCDDKMRFTHCYAGHVGSASEYSAFRSSKVFEFLGNTDRFPTNTHIIGNSVYTLHDNLMVPYEDNDKVTFRQKNYNYCLKSACDIAGKAIGLLKNRFPRLLLKLPINRMDLVPQFVTACCVLHNICLLKDDDFPELAQIIYEEIPTTEANSGQQSGQLKRQTITAQLPIRLPQY